MLPAGRRPALFTLSVMPIPAEITRATAWVEQIGAQIGLVQSAVFAVQLCLEETLSNIAQHCPEAAGLAVNLQLQAGLGHVWLQVEDCGPAFDPTSVPATTLPQSLPAADIGGLGIHLIRHFSAAQIYERANGVNRLKLSFDA